MVNITNVLAFGILRVTNEGIRSFHVLYPCLLGVCGSVHPPLSAGGVEPPTKFSKRWGGLTGTQLLERGCWERGGDFFQGGLQFSHTKKNSGIFNDKKSL